MFVLKQVFGVFYDPVFFFVNILLPKLGNCITITNTGHDSRDPVPSPSLARPHLGVVSTSKSFSWAGEP